VHFHRWGFYLGFCCCALSLLFHPAPFTSHLSSASILWPTLPLYSSSSHSSVLPHVLQNRFVSLTYSNSARRAFCHASTSLLGFPCLLRLSSSVFLCALYALHLNRKWWTIFYMSATGRACQGGDLVYSRKVFVQWYVPGPQLY